MLRQYHGASFHSQYGGGSHHDRTDRYANRSKAAVGYIPTLAQRQVFRGLAACHAEKLPTPARYLLD